jgi:hypothetical protein
LRNDKGTLNFPSRADPAARLRKPKLKPRHQAS